MDGRRGRASLPQGSPRRSRSCPGERSTLRSSRRRPSTWRARTWTEVAINELRAVASFSEVLRALVDVKAPLDLLGMTSDFLADECSHVELASRMAMELGGAAPREVDFDQFTSRPRGLTPLQRANELVLRVGCIAEAFSGGTATVSFAVDVARAAARRLRDDSSRRGASQASRWAVLRVGAVAHRRRGAAPPRPGPAHGAPRPVAFLEGPRDAIGDAAWPWPEDDLRALGWLRPEEFAPIAKEVVTRDILDPLETIGIAITPEERAELLA